ncbi:MAG: PDZ domain-containing protein [Bacteroidota bacterium]|nr:PDZ domain-containing protein [Bacteroidota bacterium]
MKFFKSTVLPLFVFLCCLPASLFAIDPTDTRMLAQPAISATHIAFIYAEDLWVANKDGSQPRRLTVDEGVELAPYFSPDGKIIAFSAEYDGNVDVFTVPVEGGIPTRLTWHPSPEVVRGFTPDGKAVLFGSQQAAFSNRYSHLFTVPVTGGMATKLTIPTASWATFSPDAKQLAYNPTGDAFRQWKHYRGGQVSVIWIFSFGDNGTIKIPQPTGGCNDANPMWIGNTIYFRSDRNGEFNLFSYNTASKKIDQLTNFKDFPLINASAGNGIIVFEQAGYLHTFSPGETNAKRIKVGIATDLQELRPRFVKGTKYIRSGDISPSGQRVVVDFRGDIVTLPAEKGDPRNLTQTVAVHEKYPAWSPDGKNIAYFSDVSGEYQLHLKSQDGKGDIKTFKLNGTGFYAFTRWSPDSKKISFVDNGRNLYVLDVTSGAIQKIDTDELYVPGPFRNSIGDWSSDSKWLAYTKVTETQFKRIYLYSVDLQKSFALTDGLSDAAEPIFDKGNKYLYFFASTDAGPVINWFDQSNDDSRSTSSIYLVTLQKETISPFAKESDEEKISAGPSGKEPADTTKKKEATPATEKKATGLSIDWEGIQNRIIDLPIKAGNYGSLGMGKEDELLYIIYPTEEAPGMMHKYDIKKRKDNEVMEMNGYLLSADGKKMLYNKSGSWAISGSGEKGEPGKGMINTEAVQVKIEPKAEWPQIFEEAWRVNRDYFYDPGMHGTNWLAMKKKYEVFLPHLTCRSDLNTLLQWMFSELAVGHHFITDRGEIMNTPARIGGGLLGADYTIDKNRYRIKKIYGGLNWNPNLRSPLTEPGVNVKEGDYLLAVNGQNVTTADNLYMFFENTAGKIVELTVGPNADNTGSRTVKVVPVANEFALRNRDWVEGNLKKVNEATKGQVAYVYVPNTTNEGHEYFKRYFYPQANKKAIIIDERFNGGGQLADYYIDILQRPYQAHWNMRYGKDLKSPSASIQGPKVMIIDETAGSGGDMLPWMFRKFNVGTLVGKRTWGGLVGILGFPEFIDGGSVTAPNVAIWTKDGFIVENEGVAPDIEVEQWPADIIKGRDPQLEKAIEIALKELEKNPSTEPVRPPYPKRTKN